MLDNLIADIDAAEAKAGDGLGGTKVELQLRTLPPEVRQRVQRAIEEGPLGHSELAQVLQGGGLDITSENIRRYRAKCGWKKKRETQ